MRLAHERRRYYHSTRDRVSDKTRNPTCFLPDFALRSELWPGSIFKCWDYCDFACQVGCLQVGCSQCMLKCDGIVKVCCFLMQAKKCASARVGACGPPANCRLKNRGRVAASRRAQQNPPESDASCEGFSPVDPCSLLLFYRSGWLPLQCLRSQRQRLCPR